MNYGDASYYESHSNYCKKSYLKFNLENVRNYESHSKWLTS